MTQNDIKALAKQRLDSMQSYSLKEILKLLWGVKLDHLTLTDDEARKLIGKGIINLQYQLDTAKAGISREKREVERLRSAPQLFKF
jgi:hypothetical protein